MKRPRRTGQPGGRRSRRPLWRRAGDIGLTLVLAAAVIFIIRQFDEEVLTGSLKVIDGDSLRTADGEIRLHGIDAPELRQTCTSGAGKPYDCGRQAARHLRRLVKGHSVACTTIDVDRYGRRVAVCQAGSTDLNTAMVSAGWAIAYTRHSFAYVRAEQAAKDGSRGLWAGQFDRPELWRRLSEGRLAVGEAGGTKGANLGSAPEIPAEDD